MDDMLDVLWVLCCVMFWDDVFIQDEVLHGGNSLWFNKLQPAECNRVSPACSVLVYTTCIVLSVMIFLCARVPNVCRTTTR